MTEIELAEKSIRGDDQAFLQLIYGPYIEIELRGGREYHHDPFSTIYDADGKELNKKSGSFSKNDEEIVKLGIDLPNDNYKNPIRFPLYGYPSYIKGDVKIKIK